MIIQFNNPAVQAAVINATASLVVAILAALIGKQIAWSRRQREQLKTATDDIAFLLAVEQAHCELHKTNSGQSNKLRIRHEVETRGLRFSGRFTPGRVQSSTPSSHQLLIWRRHRQAQAAAAISPSSE